MARSRRSWRPLPLRLPRPGLVRARLPHADIASDAASRVTPARTNLCFRTFPPCSGLRGSAESATSRALSNLRLKLCDGANFAVYSTFVTRLRALRCECSTFSLRLRRARLRPPRPLASTCANPLPSSESIERLLVRSSPNRSAVSPWHVPQPCVIPAAPLDRYLGFHRLDLGEPRAGDLDGRDEVRFAERLDHIRHCAGLAPSIDQLALTEGGKHDNGAMRSLAICSAALIPSSLGILTSMTTKSGLRSVVSATATSPSLAWPTTSYPSSLSISTRSRRMSTSSSATTTRVLAPSLIWWFLQSRGHSSQMNVGGGAHWIDRASSSCGERRARWAGRQLADHEPQAGVAECIRGRLKPVCPKGHRVDSPLRHTSPQSRLPGARIRLCRRGVEDLCPLVRLNGLRRQAAGPGGI